MMTYLFKQFGRIVMIGLFIAAGSLAFGQAIRSKNVEVNSAKQQAFGDSLKFYANGDFTSAKKVLLAANESKIDTVEWHLESANALVRVAMQFRQSGVPDASLELAQEALDELGQAQKKMPNAVDSAQNANIMQFAGFICEQLTGNKDDAIKYFKSALQYDSKALTSIEALARLQTGDQQVSKRQSYRKK